MNIHKLVEFIKEDYIQTTSGNIISRSSSARIFKPQSLEIPHGKVIIKEDVTIRSDLSTVQINKYTIVEKNTTLHPSYGIINNVFRFIPLSIGSYSYIDENCIIESASIGVGCYIGKNCILSKRSILKDYARIEDDTIVPVDMVVPPFAIVKGKPGRIVGEVHASITTLAEAEAKQRYKNMIPISRS